MDQGKWPGGAQAAIVLTLDNMGEAADITRNLWPSDQPVGDHYSVKRVLPKILDMLEKYGISATYFVESWNLSVYPTEITTISAAGHEIAWHAWRHEAWHTLDGDEEYNNFTQSFGSQGLEGFRKTQPCQITYHGFRPPGGLINGDRTLQMCKDFRIEYISPCAQQAATIKFNHGKDSMLVLPFRWRTVDAYYYMSSFAQLRRIKGEFADPDETQSTDTLVKNFIAEIDEAVDKGEYRSILFHPFLTDTEDRLEAMDRVLRHLAGLRDRGKLWLTRCQDVEKWVETHPDCVATDPLWDRDSK